jgi:hypothetical protein
LPKVIVSISAFPPRRFAPWTETLARGVQPLQRRPPPDVRVDAAHVVVGPGPDGNGVVDRVDAGEGHRELARAGEALDDLLRAQMAQVEQDVALDAAPLVDLGLLCTRDHVAARELHRVRGVALEEAIALRVEEVRALPAAPLGDEDAGRRERRRVELHHLHVLERDAGLQGHGHPVAGTGIGVRRACVEAAGAAGRQDHGLRADRLQPAVQQVPGDHALAAVLVDDELPGEELLVDEDVPFHHLLVEDVDQDVAGDVGGIRGTRRARGAERPLRDLALGGTREDRAPALELVDVRRRLVAEDLDRVLVAEVVRALDRVERVLLGAVLGGVPERRVDPAFGRAGVAADRVDLGEKRDVGALVERLDGRAHPGAAGPDDKHVMLRQHYVGRYRTVG